MDLFILNTDLDLVAIIDTYESLIWTERYDQYGDFELKMPITPEILTYIRQDYYIENPESEYIMIVEKILITSDVEKGNYITITGRSLESILDRRIVWGLQTINGTLQNGVLALLDAAIINPSDSKRRIDNFVFQYSDDPAITELGINAQFTGDNLYEAVYSICTERNLGFKIVLNADKKFIFSLYAGTDRSYDQLANPYVVFSPTFENMLNSNYVESKTQLKNVTLIGGEGEGSERRYTSVGDGSVGLQRRELFTDARDISSDTEDGELSESEYNALLVERGKEKLSDTIEIVSFEGEVDTTVMYEYRKDFFNGDIVQIANEYGHETHTRIVEVVISIDQEGRTVYPTFRTT